MKFTLRICQGVSCKNCLSDDLFKHAKSLTGDCPEITIEKGHCLSRCNVAPNLELINEETGDTEVISQFDYARLEQIIDELK